MINTDNVRVLVLAWTDRDGLASVGVFRKAGLRAELCTSPIELVLGLKAGAGAVLIAEEALSGQLLDDLAAWVGRQPPWSDLPFVVLISCQKQPAITACRQCLIVRLRNVVLLERPVQPIALASSILSSVRARRCQYAVRAHLAERRLGSRCAEIPGCRSAQQNPNRRHCAAFQALRAGPCRGIAAPIARGQGARLVGGSTHDPDNTLQAASANLAMACRRIVQAPAGIRDAAYRRHQARPHRTS